MLLLELLAERRVLHVGVERHDAIVRGAEPRERGAVRLARRHQSPSSVRRREARPAGGRALIAGRRACARTASGRERTAPRARRAPSSSSPFLSALPCQPSLPSMNEMPLPLSVAPGSSSAGRASRRLGERREQRVMSWPSTTIACQPNARHRRGERLHVVLPLRRLALPERVDVDDAAQRVELVEGGDVAASQTEPSAVSPSPSST